MKGQISLQNIARLKDFVEKEVLSGEKINPTIRYSDTVGERLAKSSSVGLFADAQGRIGVQLAVNHRDLRYGNNLEEIIWVSYI